MTYIRYIPSAPLNHYIDYFYYLEGAMPYAREKILPTGWLDLEFNFGGPIHVYDATGRQPVATCLDSWWVGVWSTYGTVEWPADIQLMGIHFKPGGAYPFLQIPLFELHNQIIPAAELWGPFAAETSERLHSVPTIEARLALLEQLLLARLGEAPHGLQCVRHAVAQIARQNGVLSIRALSDRIGISQNHLVTQFKRMVGIPPKALARLHRLKHALSLINLMSPINWTRIAHQSGYYDQSHFNNDFVTFLGHSPTVYLELRRRLQAADPEHKRLLHVLPVD